MDAVTESHSARQEALNKTAEDINQKMSKYAVIKQTAKTSVNAKDQHPKGKAGPGSQNNKKVAVKSKELAEVEAELEVSEVNPIDPPSLKSDVISELALCPTQLLVFDECKGP